MSYGVDPRVLLIGGAFSALSSFDSLAFEGPPP